MKSEIEQQLSHLGGFLFFLIVMIIISGGMLVFFFDETSTSNLNIDQEQTIKIESLIKSNGGYVINGRYQTTNQYRIGDTLTIKYDIK